MNILCISKYATLPKYGTAHTRLFYLASGFVAMGHNTTLITSNSNHFAKFPSTNNVYNWESMDEVRICWIKTKQYKKTASFARVLSWLDFECKLFSLDLKSLPTPTVVVISSLSLLTVLYGLYLKNKFGAKLVFEVRDIWPLTMIEEGGFSRWHPLVLIMGVVEKMGYKHADLVVGTMPRLDLHVKNVLGYARPFFCSPLGFDQRSDSGFSCSGNRFSGKIPANKLIVGYAGSMGITNALEPFIEAIKLLKSQSDLHFILVGDGDLRAKFRKRLAECQNVTFLEKISQTDVRFFLQHCHVVYLSTCDSKVWKYGQSMNKVVEYMRAGKPILAAYSGFPSMINEAGCGWFLKASTPEKVKQAIQEFVSLGRDELNRMGEKGKRWVCKRRSYTVLAKAYAKRLALLTSEA